MLIENIVWKRITHIIKTHSSVTMAKKTKDTWHTSVLFTGTVQLPNLAFRISKTTKPIFTKFIYLFSAYIYTTSHIKEIASAFLEISCSWKLPNFLHIFLLHTKLQIYLNCV